MKLTTILLAGAAMVATIGGTAQAANFTLSETFDTGYSYATSTYLPVTLTGTFTGTLSGQVITNLSNISLFLNGVAYNGNGNLYTAQYDPNRGFVNSGGGTLSLDNSANNALIIDSDYANKQYNYSNYFFSVPQNPDTAVEYHDGTGFFGSNAYTYPNQNSHLRVAQVIADAPTAGAVPEPATWAMMMVGFAMVGFGLRRRSKASTTVRFA